MKSVLVVGAGPAGLVAAKTLLQRAGNPFKVTVFESAERVGGMWRSREDEEGDKCSPHMRTNLSRFTVAFADLSWHSVDHGSESASPKSGDPPMFPKAYEVGRYLQEYARRFIPAEVISCNREVKTAKLGDGEPRKWTVASLDTASQKTYEDKFDYLIVASGFFHQPEEKLAFPEHTQAENKQHSSKFRDIASLTSNTPGNIVVVGGGISGSEAAATAAFQISNARFAPDKPNTEWENAKVYHVLDRPFYCLSRYLPQDPYDSSIQDFKLAPNFLPLDLLLYNLSRRGDGMITASNGKVPPEKAEKGHEFIRSLLGGDQRDVSPELAYKPGQTKYPSYTGISETYSEFVRSGLIVPIRGRAGKIVGGDGLTTVEISRTSPWAVANQETGQNTTLSLVSGIVEATGFKVHLDYLSSAVKEALDYDVGCHRVPFLLSKGSIFNPAIPEVAFVGFYEGPYWGVMEMQAQLVGQKWDTQAGVESNISTSLDESKQIREAVKRYDLSIPQFWMMDYVGLVEEFSRMAGITRNDTGFDKQSGPIFPARYTFSSKNQDAANAVIHEVQEVLLESENSARFVAAATFRAMQGTWTIVRKITSRHASSPGGHFKGTAYFHPRNPTSASASAEYLYIESGTFTMDNGFSFPATRRYIYRYNSTTDKISTFFVLEDGLSAERLFNNLHFERPESKEKGWIAKSKHWCDPDTYVSECEFRFRGVGLESFGVVYEVMGPKKDYTHESWYQR